MYELKEQLQLFPCRESVEEVEKEGLALLPITSPNTLLSLLRTMQNTAIAVKNNKNEHP